MNKLDLEWKNFEVKIDKVHSYFKQNLSSNYDGLICDENLLHVVFLDAVSQNDEDLVNDYWDNLTEETFNLTPSEIANGVILNAITFGNKIIVEYAAENVLLGITQAGMTSTVRQRTKEIVNCLVTGSLYDAMNEIRNIPSEHKDGTFISDARLLNFLNKIEDYLGLPLSEEL